MGFRGLIKGLIRYPSRLFRDELEDDISVTTFGDADLEAETKNDSQRESQRLWNFSNTRTLTDTFAPEKPGRERVYDICSFDESIFAEIFESLDLVDQVCFALTCKFLFATYKGTVKDKAILPQQPTIHRLPLSFVNSDDKLRVRLLVRLENSQWAYCAECFLLKPRRMFAPDSLAVLPLKRRCESYNGVIKFCPCLYFTLRDRNNVRALLRSSLTPPPTNYGAFGFPSDEWRCKSHVCPYHSNDNEEVQIFVSIALRSMGMIGLYVWYFLRLPESSRDQARLADPILICPHLNLWDLVYAPGNSTECRICGAAVWRGSDSQGDTDAVTFTTRLSLGYVDESDDPLWLLYCCTPEDDTQYVAPSL
ncbi:hypothetical protein N7457_001099 [Penicillium paradoxum]|uniref:uncharacterized protein n=1 Tax=Penicillium paradoxum TaxID=176176 RepID=UPI002548FA58|nr:uncharacterized protein N7457_001099 [Penicillium paradoxum]KAJ5794500.1 hypothetical protein N7457_001099 [Penicillium paradoxum]